MAVTGTTTFSVSTQDIIEYALRKCGALALGVSVDSTTSTQYTKNLNIMIKNLIAKPGVRLWTIVELSLPLTASKATYILGNSTSTPGTPDLITDKPMKLFQAWLRNTTVTPNVDTPMQIIAQQSYNVFGSKFSTGTPNSVYMEVDREQSTVKMYPEPDSTAATTYTMHLLIQRPLYDMTNLTDTFDFPSEWYLPLGWMFAREIMLDFGCSPQRRQEIKEFAAQAEDQITAFDGEYNSTFFAPDMRNRKR